MNLEGKTALVTGGGSGLGLSITKKLLARGAKIIIVGRTQTTLDQAKQNLNSDNVIAKSCDITDYSQIEKLAQEVGSIDILVNCAGVWTEGKLEDCPVEKITQTLDINLKGNILVTKVFLPQLKQKTDAYIINIVSVSALKIEPGRSIYNAAKHGLDAFTDTLRKDLKGTKVKVVGIYPGGMNTPLYVKAGQPIDTQKYLDTDKVAEVIIFVLEREDPLVIEHIVVERSNK